MGWKKHKLESRLLGEISITSAMQMPPPLGQKVNRNSKASMLSFRSTLISQSKEELKSLLIKVKEEREKTGLKLNIKKNKIMASGPITSWQIDGETMETVFSWAPKSLQTVTAAMKLKDTCSLEYKLSQT